MSYKLNQIKRLIESLDLYEARELIDYLMEEENIDIDDLSIEEIAVKVENGELPETKELLMKADELNQTVAHLLANNSDNTNWKTDDKDILMLQDADGWSVAHALAYFSYDSGWETDNKDVLMLQDKDGWSVAHGLAGNSHTTNWKTDDKDILMLQDNNGWSVAHELAEYHPTWITHDPEILSLIDEIGEMVEDMLKKKGKI